nr:glycosyltransferase family 39 protein [Streptomyces sp. NBC_00886]
MSALGLWGLDRGGMWGDEGVTFLVGRRTVPQIWRLLHGVDAVHGLYYLFMHAVLAARPDEVALRLPSVCGAAATAGLVAALGVRLARPRVGLWAGLLYAITPLTGHYAQEGRSYALVAAGVAGATLLLVRCLEGRSWWPYGAVLAVTFLLHELAVLVLCAHALTLAAARVPRAVWVGWGRAVGVAVGVLLPLVWVSQRQSAQVAWLRTPDRDTAERLTREFLAVAPTGAVFWTSVLLMLVGLGAGRLTSVALPLLVVPPVILLTVSQFRPLFHERYVLYALAGAPLLAAAGADRLVGAVGRLRPDGHGVSSGHGSGAGGAAGAVNRPQLADRPAPGVRRPGADRDVAGVGSRGRGVDRAVAAVGNRSLPAGLLRPSGQRSAAASAPASASTSLASASLASASASASAPASASASASVPASASAPAPASATASASTSASASAPVSANCPRPALSGRRPEVDHAAVAVSRPRLVGRPAPGVCRPPRASLITLAGVLAVALPFLHDLPTYRNDRSPAHRPENLAAVSALAGREMRPGDPVLFLPSFWRVTALAYPGPFLGARDMALGESGSGSGTLSGREVAPGELRERLAAVDRVWIVAQSNLLPSRWVPGDPTDRVKLDVVDEEFARRREYVRGRVKLGLYVRRMPPPVLMGAPASPSASPRPARR